MSRRLALLSFFPPGNVRGKGRLRFGVERLGTSDEMERRTPSDWLRWRHTSFSMSRLVIHISFLALYTTSLAGCASLGDIKERYVACSYDTVWEVSLDRMREYPVMKEEKERGLIETTWIESTMHGRPYGLLQREGLENKERFRMMLTLNRVDEATVLRLSEQREHWGFRGGSRIYQWYPLEPSEERLNHVMADISTHLEGQGCFVGS